LVERGFSCSSAKNRSLCFGYAQASAQPRASGKPDIKLSLHEGES
jgi:hypothetical protein